MHVRLLLFFLLLSLTTHAASGIKDIYLLREKGKTLLQEKKYDSAALYFSRITTDDTYANATDYLNLSLCRLQVHDTATFKQHLIHSIETGGADSALVYIYFRPLDSTGHVYFKTIFNTVYATHRNYFLNKVDPAIEKEMKEILYLDQICRRQEDLLYNQQHKGDTTNPNRHHIRTIGRYIDSVNYYRVLALIKSNSYPGFHNFGITASNYSPILMHITDHDEEQWNTIFTFLKQQVHSGNIMPNEVVAIATRHYQKQGCTYYGTIKWGLTTPCNCAQVDKFRAEIGLESLKQECQRSKQTLPACYHE